MALTRAAGMAAPDESVTRPLIVARYSCAWMDRVTATSNASRDIRMRRSALQGALDNLVTIDLYDRSILQAYVEVQRFSRRVASGLRVLNANDAWIVACAKAAGAVLLTTDADFGHLKAPDWPIQFVDPKPFLKASKEA